MSRTKIKKKRKKKSGVPAALPVTLVDQKTGEEKTFTVGELLESITSLKTMHETLIQTVEGAFDEFDKRILELEGKKEE